MSVRLDDATAVISDLLNTVLLAHSVSLRADGVPAANTTGDWATLDLRWSSGVRSAPDERAGASLRLTLYLQVTQQAIYKARTVAEAVRAALVAQNLAVYGGISGTPGDLQGILQTVDFQQVILGETGGELITDLTCNLIERT